MRDRKRIAHLYLLGWTQIGIADELGVSQSTVSRDLKTLQKEWQKSAVMDLNEIKVRELARIDNVENTYWDAWGRSLRDKATSNKEISSEGGGGESSEPSVQRDEMLGDPRFLQGVERCIKRRCRLLGLDAPSKFAPTDPTGEYAYDSAITDKDRLGALLDLYDRVGARISASVADGESSVEAATESSD